VTYWDRLREVIDYLEGRIDIYDGKYEEAIKAWDNAWSEMLWQGFEPDTVAGIKKIY